MDGYSQCHSTWASLKRPEGGTIVSSLNESGIKLFSDLNSWILDLWNNNDSILNFGFHSYGMLQEKLMKMAINGTLLFLFVIKFAKIVSIYTFSLLSIFTLQSKKKLLYRFPLVKRVQHEYYVSLMLVRDRKKHICTCALQVLPMKMLLNAKLTPLVLVPIRNVDKILALWDPSPFTDNILTDQDIVWILIIFPVPFLRRTYDSTFNFVFSHASTIQFPPFVLIAFVQDVNHLPCLLLARGLNSINFFVHYDPLFVLSTS